MNLQLLFPTPIGIVDHPNIPVSDHDELLNQTYSVTNGSYGQFSTSTDTFILNNHAPTLAAWILDQVNTFAMSTLACRNKLKFTQSWCLKHKDQAQQVFNHAHVNSIISGAYYVDAPTGTQGIRFHKNVAQGAPFVRPEFDNELLKDQPWAWEWHEIPVQTGRLVLFPSSMYHSVDGSQVMNQRRCVLSFNTWFDGPIGCVDKLSWLG